MTLAHPKFTYTHGLHELGDGAYAWLQPDGGWGWSNSGMLVAGKESLIIDTLFDVPLTEAMLKAYHRAAPQAAGEVNCIVNTHHNGDHCNGNQCCPQAKIIAHRLTVEAQKAEPPAMLQGFLDQADALGELGRYITSCFGPFDFRSVVPRYADETFETDLALSCGELEVQLTHVGPAHTPGDTLVHVPSAKLVYSGDILFIGGHPIIWEGPVQNWLDACDKILAWRPELVVPGHGPITTCDGVRAVRAYLTYVWREAKARHAAGLSFRDAAFDIALTDYSSWGDAERIVINCAAVYKELGAFAAEGAPDIPTLFSLMAEFKKQRSQK